MSSILSISQLNKYVAFKLKSDVKLKGICVKGEISNFTVNIKSGHAYFTVKDAGASIKAVMFSSSLQRVKAPLSDGQSVLVTGNVELYEAGGSYQIVVTDVTPLGSGLLHVQTELVKEKLLKQGVFDEASKKAIPLFPRKIAIVSSLTGAALQDILNIIQRRFPICTVVLFHTQVQGEKAADNIRDSLKKADSCGADTIILARGGGSLEDLMPFNTEIAAIAVHECSTPIISAVGHETDTTLVDHAADLRAPTPSAAAELATPSKAELIGAVDSLKSSLDRAFDAKLNGLSSELQRISTDIKRFSPQKKLERDGERVDVVSKQLHRALNNKLERLGSELDKYAGSLTALSPFGVLTRGYSIIRKDNKAVRCADELNNGDRVTINFRDDTAQATLTDISRKE